MDKVVLLLLADVGFFRTDNGYANWTYMCQVESQELDRAEQAADKLENWLNNLSL